MEDAVVLMAKAPVAGRVKTRLCPPLDPRESAALYACMLGDTAGEVSTLPRVRRYLFLDPPGVGGLPAGGAVFRVRAVSAAWGGPRGQDAGRGRDRVPARGASRGDRGGGLPVALGGDGPSGVPGAFHRSVGRLRPLRGRRILPGRPLLAGRTAVPGIPMEHRGGAAERGGALQDPFGAVLVPASRAGRGHRGGPSRAEGVGEDARAARVPPDPGVDHRFLWAGRRRIPRVAGTNTRSSPRFTISPRRVTDLTPFGTSISNAPDSPRRSAPSPRNGDFGKIALPLRPPVGVQELRDHPDGAQGEIGDVFPPVDELPLQEEPPSILPIPLRLDQKGVVRRNDDLHPRQEPERQPQDEDREEGRADDLHPLAVFPVIFPEPRKAFRRNQQPADVLPLSARSRPGRAAGNTGIRERLPGSGSCSADS